MNNGAVIFFGLFASMAVSWATFVIGPMAQMGGMQQTRTVAALPAVYPNTTPGLARQGVGVYRAGGCAYCHTEQVRPRELGSDLAHGWGVRRSVAHDYIFEETVMPGSLRLGPDLANAGMRMDARAVLMRLWDARLFVPKSVMPPYKYLFDVRRIGRTPSPDALAVPSPEGYEIIPRPAARALAAYVANLRQESFLFEAPPPPGWVNTNKPVGGTNAPTGGTNAPGGGTNVAAPAGSGVPALPGGANVTNPQSTIK